LAMFVAIFKGTVCLLRHLRHKGTLVLHAVEWILNHNMGRS
jgi:hypothetical protein